MKKLSQEEVKALKSPNWEAQRAQKRLPLGPGSFIGFVYLDEVNEEVQITDLSAGGVCASLTQRQAKYIEKGTILSRVQLKNPDITKTEFLGKVAWMMGKTVVETEEKVTVGIAFQNVDPSSAEAINGFVQARL